MPDEGVEPPPLSAAQAREVAAVVRCRTHHCGHVFWEMNRDRWGRHCLTIAGQAVYLLVPTTLWLVCPSCNIPMFWFGNVPLEKEMRLP